MYKAREVKSSNYDRILECVYRHPGISRKEISKLTGITPATVTTTVAVMSADGVIAELGQVKADRGSIGRSRIALDVVAEHQYTIGVEFNFTALSVCVADLHGKLLYFHTEPYTLAMGQQITQNIIRSVKECIQELRLPKEKILGIGVGIPGHMDGEDRFMISTNMDWEDFDALKIRKAFSCPVVFENNIRCIAVAYYLHDPAHTPSSFALFHVGRGIFCANMTEDGLYIGNTYGSGEVGHTIAIPDGKPCKCGKCGCLETVMTEGALLDGAAQIFCQKPGSLLHNFAEQVQELTIENVLAAYTLGDADIRRLIAQALRYQCISILNVSTLLSPGKLFLHGKLFNSSEIQRDLMEMIYKEFSFTGSDYRLGSVDFKPYLEEDGALGGAALVIWKCLIHA